MKPSESVLLAIDPGMTPAMHHGVWELVFLMVILKIPILYLCGVVYYAIKAEPTPRRRRRRHRAPRPG